MKRIFSFLSASIGMLLLTAFVAPQKSITIHGVVTDKQTGKTVENVHVYVVHGEEEAMTDPSGKFRITTWQGLPVKVYAEATGFKKTTWVVENPSQAQHIQLVKR